MKKIMLEVEVPDDFGPLKLDSFNEKKLIVGHWDSGFNSFNFRIVEPAVQAQGEPVAIVEASDYQTAAALLGNEPRKIAVKELMPGALKIGNELYTHHITDGSGREEKLIEALRDIAETKNLTATPKQYAEYLQRKAGEHLRQIFCHHQWGHFGIGGWSGECNKCGALKDETPPQSDAQEKEILIDKILENSKQKLEGDAQESEF